MKTFEEAFKIVTDKQNKDKLVADMKDANSLMDNEKWKGLIQGVATATVIDIIFQPNGEVALEKAIASVCASLHTVWAVAQLTGQEMEKSEGGSISYIDSKGVKQPYD